MSLTSVELNYLIFRYLQESGFDLVAYALDKASHCSDYEKSAPKAVELIERGCLVSLVQKGLLYSLAETDALGTSSVSLFNSLLREELEKAQSEAPIPITPEPEPKQMFTTKTLQPMLSFEESLVADWHPSSQVFAYGRSDSTAVIDALAGASVAESVTLNHSSILGVNNEINIVSWSPQGNVIVTAGFGELRAWSPDGKLKNMASTDETEKKALSSLLWGNSGQFLLSIDVANVVTLWDATLTPMKQIREQKSDHPPLDACWLDDSTFAVSTVKNSIKIYSIEQNSAFCDVQQVGFLHGHKHPITSLRFNPDLKLLASCSDNDYSIRVWSRGSASEMLDINAHSVPPTVKYHAAPIIGLFWLPNALLSVSVDGVANIWDKSTGANTRSTELFRNQANFSKDAQAKPDALVFAAALAPDKKCLAVGDDYGWVTFWKVPDLCCVAVYKMGVSGTVGVCDLQWDAEGKKVFVGYKGAKSVIIDLEQ